VAQVLVHVIERRMSLQEAIAAPRVHNEGDVSQVDAALGAETIERLERLGHEVEVLNPTFGLPAWSRINGIQIDESGELTSGLDPYTDAGAAAPTPRDD
jgi:gamma-glutamyltranspeptidase / glutathione hydrolase